MATKIQEAINQLEGRNPLCVEISHDSRTVQAVVDGRRETLDWFGSYREAMKAAKAVAQYLDIPLIYSAAWHSTADVVQMAEEVIAAGGSEGQIEYAPRGYVEIPREIT